MKYVSTRNNKIRVSASEALNMGISPDGGLFVPEARPVFSIDQMISSGLKDYKHRTVEILEPFLPEFEREEIIYCVDRAYNLENFDTPEITPVKKIGQNIHVLELWHGPTCAFKDMALQLLPGLMVKSWEKAGEQGELVILTATSGDTGKAALEGFKDMDRTNIIVFYPENGVSDVQKAQMITQEGSNVHVAAVEGNFDDAQNGVKSIFTDNKLKDLLRENNYKFSSANSINWGRLVPQIVYYFSAYMDMVNAGEITAGESINIVVPTGNFGNILAAYYAGEMGLPVNKLICASNKNNILTDFINTGLYDKNRDFEKTISPSMDILISSNLERLLFELAGHDSDQINRWMDELKKTGRYSIDGETRNKLQCLFWGGYATDDETLSTIKETYTGFSYVMDTHTAVGKSVYDKYIKSTSDNRPVLIVSTASPFKFNYSVASALLSPQELTNKNEFELLGILAEYTGLQIPEGLKDLDKKKILHSRKCNKRDMKDVIMDILSL